MIFVTIGGNTPFDRLIQAVDGWAESNPQVDLLAQVGEGVYEPRHMRWSRFLEPAEFQQTLRSAELVVSHAGMGTILSALDLRVPLIVLPRRASLQEQRNEHQAATVAHLAGRGLFHPADDEHELVRLLDQHAVLPELDQHSSGANLQRLQQAVVAFIEAGE